MTHYFVTRMEYIPHTPSSCMGCGKEDLVSDAIIAQTGPAQNNVTDKDTVLCLACETLMIITDEEKKFVALRASEGNVVTLRSSKQ